MSVTVAPTPTVTQPANGLAPARLVDVCSDLLT
jgi:hypothetical protein